MQCPTSKRAILDGRAIPSSAATERRVAVYPTERDIEIFKLLVRFRYLPSDYIHAFVGGNVKRLDPPPQSPCRASPIFISRVRSSNARTPMPTIAT